MLERIREDIQTVFAKDPAARNIVEIMCCYPGLQAIWLHRVSNFLWQRKFLFLGRFVSHLNRWLTGVEIHPGAHVGRRFFIDHGMGVVIGETAEIGDDVLMYQGVVLGGTSSARKKRHPTIGNNVVVGTGATILGPIIVGADAKIGAGSVVIKSVPAGATIVGVPGRIAGAEPKGKGGADLEHGRLPDPVVRTLSKALDQHSLLEERVRKLERTLSQATPTELVVPEHSLAPPREADIRDALRQVIDPEIGVNIVDLGLIRDITLNGRGVEVRMVTCLECSLMAHLVEQVRRKVRSIVGQEPVEVVLLDETWNWNYAISYFAEGGGI